MTENSEIVEIFTRVVIAARSPPTRKLRAEFEAERHLPIVEEKYGEQEAAKRFRLALLAARGMTQKSLADG